MYTRFCTPYYINDSAIYVYHIMLYGGIKNIIYVLNFTSPTSRPPPHFGRLPGDYINSTRVCYIYISTTIWNIFLLLGLYIKIIYRYTVTTYGICHQGSTQDMAAFDV